MTPVVMFVKLGSLLVLLATASVAARHDVITTSDKEFPGSSLTRAARQLVGCPVAPASTILFSSPLYEPSVAYKAEGLKGASMQITSTGWHDMIPAWDDSIASIKVGGGTLLMLWEEELSHVTRAAYPPYVLGEGTYPTMPPGFKSSVSTILAMYYESSEPSFVNNMANMISRMRQGYGKDAAIYNNAQLTSAADAQATYMFKQKKLTVVGPKGSRTLKERLAKAGYGKHQSAVEMVLKVKFPATHSAIFNALVARKKDLEAMLKDYSDIGTGWGWNGDKNTDVYICIVLGKQ